MAAPGLTAENRERLKRAIVAELSPVRFNKTLGAGKAMIDDYRKRRGEAYGRALQRLESAMEPNQYALAEAYVRKKAEERPPPQRTTPKPE